MWAGPGNRRAQKLIEMNDYGIFPGEHHPEEEIRADPAMKLAT